jgi:nitroreductase
MEFTKTLRTRRTHKSFSGEDLLPGHIDLLLSAAIYAPNHRRNEPWRFTVVKKEELPALWQSLKPEIMHLFAPELVESKLQSLQKIFYSAAVLVFVSYLSNPNELIEKENYAATCCAIPNMLLQAADLSVGSYWATGQLMRSEQIRKVLQIAPDTAFAGAVFFGLSAEEPKPPGFGLEGKVQYWRAK